MPLLKKPMEKLLKKWYPHISYFKKIKTWEKINSQRLMYIYTVIFNRIQLQKHCNNHIQKPSERNCLLIKEI